MAIESVGTPFMWAGFIVLVLSLLAIDLGIFHRRAHKVGIKEALSWTIIWISSAFIFNLLIWYWFGQRLALEFLTGYLIEKALSVDNLFIFVVIFSYFGVPSILQHRVLFWGILGALCFRAVFIILGAVLLQKFHWLMYPLGLLLLWTGARLFFEKVTDVHPEKNFVVRFFQRFIPMTKNFRGSSFLVMESGRLYATPLLLVLITIEATDLIFAVDSIPAIFAVTKDPFIVFTSNIFALLGLRALYFAIAQALGKFYYLRLGLALVLVFVGTKMLISSFYTLPIALSLGIVILLIGGAIVASIYFPPQKRP